MHGHGQKEQMTGAVGAGEEGGEGEGGGHADEDAGRQEELEPMQGLGVP